MVIRNINIVAKHQIKLTKRSWIFRVGLGLMLTIFFFSALSQQTYLLGGWNITKNILMSAQMPYLMAVQHNFMWIFIIPLLTSGFAIIDKKIDTNEVFMVKSISNTELLLGRLLAMIKLIFVITLAFALYMIILNVFVNNSPFDIYMYIFYPSVVIFPSAFFVLGLTYIISSLTNNKAITMVLVIGIIFLILQYFSRKFYGIADFMNIEQPMMISDITKETPYMASFLHRQMAYLFMGLGLIFLSVLRYKRIPSNKHGNKISLLFALIFISSSIYCISNYISKLDEKIELRAEYRNTYNKYADAESVSVKNNSISLNHLGDKIEVISNLNIINKGRDKDSVVLYLNPGLEILHIKSDSKDIKYKRDNQAVVLDLDIAENEEMKLQIHYKGNIINELCYTDVADKELVPKFAIVAQFYVAKQYAFLSKNYTLLTPESVWYPQANPANIPKSKYSVSRDFTKFDLNVKGVLRGKEIISQGHKSDNGKSINFRNINPLVGLSLCIGDYECDSIDIDGVKCSFYRIKGYNNIVEEFKEIKDSIPSILSSIKDGIEVPLNSKYPNDRFSIIEVPANFYSYNRPWKVYQEHLAPEMVFVREKYMDLDIDFYTQNKRRRFNRNRGNEGNYKYGSFRDLVGNFLFGEKIKQGIFSSDNKDKINPYNQQPQFKNMITQFYDEKYPIIDNILSSFTSLKKDVDNKGVKFFVSTNNQNGLTPENDALLYLRNHSFADAIADSIDVKTLNSIISLKGDMFLGYLKTKLGEYEILQFIAKIIDENKFKHISFSYFTDELYRKYGLDITEFTDKWYNGIGVPNYEIKDANLDVVTIDNISTYVKSFKIYNSSSVDGIISVDGDNYYIIPSNQAFEIRIRAKGDDNVNDEMVIDKNISTSLYRKKTFEIFESNTNRNTFLGVKRIPDTEFLKPEDSIILDNEDSSFSILSMNNKQERLRKLFRKKDDKQKYFKITSFRPSSTWAFFLSSNCYGEISSGVYIKGGIGDNKVQWETEIKEEGQYNVYVWDISSIFNQIGFGSRRRKNRNRNKLDAQIYEIETSLGKEEFKFEDYYYASDWRLINTYYLPKGKLKIRLSDKTSNSVIIADAIKLEKVKD